MKKTSFLSLLVLTFFVASSLSCSSVGPRKYVFFGDPQAERVEMFEDYWSDFPFKPDDPRLPLRRGKGGVVRFFKKDSYTRSIMVDGDLTVNVYYSSEDGVSLREPDSQLVLTSEELNSKHRKFDKEAGYSYHVYLDLGVYDQPEEEITILSTFKDAKTGQTTLSKEIHTTAMGTTPLKKNEEDEDDIERWTKKRLEKIRNKGLTANDDDEENEVEEVEEDYEDDEATTKKSRSARRQASNGKKKTSVRGSVDLTDTQFEDLDFQDNPIDAVSYTENATSKRNAALLDALERNQEKLDYYRANDRRRLEEIRQEYEDYENGEEISPVKRIGKGGRFSKSKSRSSSRYVDMQSDLTDQFEELSDQLSSGFEEKYEQEAKKRNRTLRKTPPQTLRHTDEDDADLDEEHDDEYEEEPSVTRGVKSVNKARLVDEEYEEESPYYDEEEQEYETRTPVVKKPSASKIKRAAVEGFYEVKPSGVSYEESKQSSRKAVDASPYVYNEEEYEPGSVWSTKARAVESEMDRLDDFQPDDKTVKTEVVVRKKTTRR